MLCNNLIDKINYVNSQIISQGIDLNNYGKKSLIMQEYCEKCCEIEYCQNYRLRTGKIEEISN